MSSWKPEIYSFIWICFILSAFSCKHNKPVQERKNYNETKKQMVEVNRILVKKDQQRIKGYLERQNIEMHETGTGLWYSIEVPGDGPKAEPGKRATINYKISLLDGTECYNSEKDGPKTFTIGRGRVESGLEEGILLLNEGGIASFIIPPYLAYGLPGDGNCIPPRAIILYYVKLLSIDELSDRRNPHAPMLTTGE